MRWRVQARFEGCRFVFQLILNDVQGTLRKLGVLARPRAEPPDQVVDHALSHVRGISSLFTSGAGRDSPAWFAVCALVTPLANCARSSLSPVKQRILLKNNRVKRTLAVIIPIPGE